MIKKNKKKNSLTWAEIDLKAIIHNYHAILSTYQKNNDALAKMVPVIKADAYGHGVKQIAALLNKEGVEIFGISDIDEGIELRKLGIKKPILLLECPLPEQTRQVIKHDLTCVLYSLSFARSLNKRAKKKGKVVDVHIKVDTGMGRFGVWQEEIMKFFKKMQKFNNLRINGILTHFPSADCDKPFTERQIENFLKIVTKVKAKYSGVQFIHVANSMASVALNKDGFCNLIRPGLMLYGLYPHTKCKPILNLKPAMQIKTKIVFLKEVEEGRSISYGRTFVASHKMKVATLPIGYSNGYFRCFSNNSYVLVDGIRCPVIGRVTMDQIMVDVSHAKNVQLGSEVVILGRQKSEFILADDLAQWAGTINYEIVCSLGSQLPRIFKS